MFTKKNKPHLSVVVSLADFASSAQPATSRSDVRAAACLSNTRLTGPSWFQDTRHLTFAISPPTSYQPGDVMHFLPSNSPSRVSRLLSLLGDDLRSKADAALTVSTSPTADPLIKPTHVWPSPTTLRCLLRDAADLGYTGVSVDTLHLLSHLVDLKHPLGEAHFKKLRSLSAASGSKVRERERAVLFSLSPV